MDARTRKALEASIKHWEENVAAETPDAAKTNRWDCALCDEFFISGCDGCPVSEKTGRRLCIDSPYAEADNLLYSWGNGKPTKEQWQEAARAELEFLKSLLPEDDAQ